MGLHFGNLGVKVRGVVAYRLSPFEQKAFAGAVSHGLPNLFRRFREEVMFIAPRKFLLKSCSMHRKFQRSF
jgi:ubiquinol-cytochrome c reductase subunit 8